MVTVTEWHVFRMEGDRKYVMRPSPSGSNNFRFSYFNFAESEQGEAIEHILAYSLTVKGAEEFADLMDDYTKALSLLAGPGRSSAERIDHQTEPADGGEGKPPAQVALDAPRRRKARRLRPKVPPPTPVPTEAHVDPGGLPESDSSLLVDNGEVWIKEGKLYVSIQSGVAGNPSDLDPACKQLVAINAGGTYPLGIMGPALIGAFGDVNILSNPQVEPSDAVIFAVRSGSVAAPIAMKTWTDAWRNVARSEVAGTFNGLMERWKTHDLEPMRMTPYYLLSICMHVHPKTAVELAVVLHGDRNWAGRAKTAQGIKDRAQGSLISSEEASRLKKALSRESDGTFY